MSDDDYESTHPAFLRGLKDSQQAVWVMASWLSEQGFSVRIPHGVVPTPTHADWRDYSDQGDLELGLRIEVKRLTCEFTCADDWPFPSVDAASKNFIVCSRHSWDMANPRPSRFYYLNRAMTHAAIIRPASSSERWRVETIKAGNHGDKLEEFYVCDVSCASFICLADDRG